MKKKLITELDIRKIEKAGSTVVIFDDDCLFTPLALDRIKEQKLTLVKKKINTPENLSNEISSASQNKIAIGSDHTGFKLKNILIKYLNEKNIETIDAGTFDENSCDYPDIAEKVSQTILNGQALKGILIDATGIPSAITANKFKGIRAATCYNEFSAKSSREHNNSNIIVLGAKSLGEESIKSILNVWLNTAFLGGRHQKRLDKITAIEVRKKS
jgi:ribose 5-phosphate isomerase B